MGRGRSRDQSWTHAPRQGDISTLFAVVIAGALLAPQVLERASDLAFGLPLVLLAFALVHCAVAARRPGAARGVWLWLCVAVGFGAAASAVAVGTAVAGAPETVAFYLGAAGSVALLLSLGDLCRRTIPRTGLEQQADALLFAAVILAVGVWFIAIPGFQGGDDVLTAVFLVDLVAVVLAALSMPAPVGGPCRAVRWSLLGACVAVAVGDGVLSAASAGQLKGGSEITAVLWALAGYLIALGADADTRPEPEEHRGRDDEAGSGRVYARVLLPLAAVLAFPAIGLALVVAGRADASAAIYFGIFFVVASMLAFGKQAYLLVENRRAVARERRLRTEVSRRNEELEALTGLATTMTQSLEEAPIVEQGLDVLRLAARASSAALHTWGEDGAASLAAAAGDWYAEHTWAARPGPHDDPRRVECRGGRQIARLELAAREHRIGVVTLIRRGEHAFETDELNLLGLLADQLAIAVQNARDYREKLYQAVRDPLTGLYNRRYFYEALENEVLRSERYGSTASLVIFDIDDFKSVNDTFGHAAGDEVLRNVGRLVEGLLRPADSFARIGGEEFALLLPETDQLGALLVAERLRTAIARQEILPARPVTMSGGVSSCPQDGRTTDELQRKADGALYWAKANGKNLCAVASEAVLDDSRTDGMDMMSHFHAVVTAMDSQAFHTRDHSENVAIYTVALGQALRLDSERIVCLRRAGLLHDIGKIAVSESVLLKPEPLNDAEYEEMKLHSTAGATMVLNGGLSTEALWIRHHHERIDGDGYPDGLAGDEIPFESRIIFVADAFEAMTSDRPYRRGMDVEAALDELRRNSGTQFEPAIVDALVGLVEQGRLDVLALRS